MDFKQRYSYDSRKDFLGKGGFSTVFRAYDKVTDIYVALKFFDVSPSKKFNIIDEMRRLIKLNHPNVLRVYDIQTVYAPSYHGGTEAKSVGVMEYINSGTLVNFMQLQPDEKTFKNVIIEILEGLKYIHAKGVIHRDIKPQNIFMQRDDDGKWIPKIGDFGISKDLTGVESSSSAIVGTVEYMAPEQFNAKRFGIHGKISTNVDLWSLGIILYELLTHKMLYGRRSKTLSTEELIHRICYNPVPNEIAQVPLPYRKVIQRCLVKNANERCGDANELIQILNSNPAPRAAVPRAKEKSQSALAIWIIMLALIVFSGSAFVFVKYILPDLQGSVEEEPVASNSLPLTDSIEVLEAPFVADASPVENVDTVSAGIIIENSDESVRYKTLVREADELFNRTLYQSAKEKYLEALWIEPTDEHVNSMLDSIKKKEEVFLANKKKEETSCFRDAKKVGSIEKYEHCLRKYPDSDQAWIAKIELDMLKDSLKMRKDSLIEKGKEKFKSGAISQAELHSNEARKIDPSNEKKQAVTNNIDNKQENTVAEKIITENNAPTEKKGDLIKPNETTPSKIPNGNFSDPRDGKTYKWVEMTGMKWMAENLNYVTKDSWCYDNNQANCITYGRLYTWNSAKKACPEGWRLPSYEDWKKLINANGGYELAGEILLEILKIKPGGARSDNYIFTSVGKHSCFWSSTYTVSGKVAYFVIAGTRIEEREGSSTLGFSCRCVKN